MSTSTFAQFLFACLVVAFASVFAPSEAAAQNGGARCQRGVLTIPDQRPQIVFEDSNMCTRFARPYTAMLRGDCQDAMCRGAASRIENLNEELESTDIVVISRIGGSILYRCSAEGAGQVIESPQIRAASLIDRTIEMRSGAEVNGVRCP